jgi:hypothetical protein
MAGTSVSTNQRGAGRRPLGFTACLALVAGALVVGGGTARASDPSPPTLSGQYINLQDLDAHATDPLVPAEFTGDCDPTGSSTLDYTNEANGFDPLQYTPEVVPYPVVPYPGPATVDFAVTMGPQNGPPTVHTFPSDFLYGYEDSRGLSTGELQSVDATFSIETADGTVTGTIHMPEGGDASARGTCYDDLSGVTVNQLPELLSGWQFLFVARNLTYEASITTPAGVFHDEGTARMTARNEFLRYSECCLSAGSSLELAFTSALDGPADQSINFGAVGLHLVDKNNQASPDTSVTATSVDSNGSPTGLHVSFSASGVCTVSSPSQPYTDPITNVTYPFLDGDGVTHVAVTVNGVGTCTLTATQPGSVDYNAAPSVTQSFQVVRSLVMGPQAMEGDLKITPGTDGVALKAGYDFTIPGNHAATTVTFLGAYATFPYTCLSSTGNTISGGGTINVPMADASYFDPVNSSAWFPSGDHSAPSVYQGSYTMAQSLCGAGNAVRLQQGGTFHAGISETPGTEKVNVRWHYSANGSKGGWSGTLGVLPS